MLTINKEDLQDLERALAKAIEEVEDDKKEYALYRLRVLRNNLKQNLDLIPDKDNIYNLQMRQRRLR